MQTESFANRSRGRGKAFAISKLAALTLFLVLLSVGSTWGQSNRTNSTRKVFRDLVEPHWLKGDDQFWYRIDLANGAREFWLVDAVQGKRAAAFDQDRMAKALSDQTGKAVQSSKLPVDSIQFSEDRKKMTVTTPDESWECDLETYHLTKVPAEEKKAASNEATPSPERGRRRTSGTRSTGIRSPDGAWEALVRGHNLYLREVKAGTEKALTYDANPTDSYARNAERDRAIEMEFEAREPDSPVPEVYWAPDSQRFVAMRVRAGTQRTVYEVESSPEDQLQPKLQSYPYLKPGDDVPIRKPHLFDVSAAKEIPIQDALFLNPWSIQNVRWRTNSQEFTFEFNQRGHQVFRILGVNATTGAVRSIVDEQSPTFFCYSGNLPKASGSCAASKKSTRTSG
jgi:hypothetical protein